MNEPERTYSKPDDRPIGPHGKRIPHAVYASNWWVVLLVDAAGGLVVTAIGVALAVLWHLLIGAAIAAVGVVYLALIGRRFLQWRWLRGEAGLR
ncbi:MAG: hypothetical protein ACR2QK_09980 [Acidimicrobiales bacterium]